MKDIVDLDIGSARIRKVLGTEVNSKTAIVGAVELVLGTPNQSKLLNSKSRVRPTVQLLH